MIDSVLEYIRRALTNHKGIGGDNLLDCRWESVKTRPFSKVGVLVIKTGQGTQRLLAKTTVYHPVNRQMLERENQAVAEFRMLERLSAQFHGIEGCAVPRPILLLPEIDTYVMEYIDGVLLDDCMVATKYMASRPAFSALQRYYYLVGRWLKEFQRICGTRSGRADDMAGILARCNELLDHIREFSGGRDPHNIREQVLKLLDMQMEQLKREEISLTFRHGDFGPWNVLVTKMGITVIDFFGCEECPPLVDLLRILGYLEDERHCLASSPRRIKRLKKCFLDGYGALPRIPLPLQTICETLQHLTSLTDCYLFAKNGSVHHRLERWLLRRSHLAWLAGRGGRRSFWTDEH